MWVTGHSLHEPISPKELEGCSSFATSLQYSYSFEACC